ncbi:hypothetical protein AMATHDRAFT_53720 [Amanita thiersii Skay4041]|uniref:NAD(P)-binding protein n=1 Tax=Amanita thiersii Skay4041 TaxID=703135 RepID=A0A2A9P0L1_9AGAR|nr:hypothetical protein AMATHDRAFT_53720 [Amanita thiersii Skay4041]
MSKVILVTGANTGIGFELVRLLAQKGHIVYLAARNESAGREAVTKLVKEKLNVKFVLLDVTSASTIKEAKSLIEQNEGKLDVLVNNAGVAQMDKDQNATTIDVSVIRETVEVNLFGLVQTTTTLLPLLRASSQAVILNVTTDMASNSKQAEPDSSLHFVAYNTSKAAANSYTIALAHELRKEGIKVNAVTPGFTSTKLNFFGQGGKSVRQGAEILLPWALLGKDGPTGLFIDENGKEMAW